MRVPSAPLAIFLFLILASPLFAQGGARQSTPNPNSPAQREMQAREWALTHIPDEVNQHFKKDSVSLFSQIREDFTRLQLINNEMMQTVFLKKNVDKKLIAATTSEINKRANRLKDNLVLPKAADDNQQPKDSSKTVSLETELLTLDQCIMSFATNPLFKQPKVVDPSLAAKARHDLDLIIRLSDQLKTSVVR
jgi:uncharacterized membrane-anchored protein YhcB (DUF1043 family)